MGELRKLHEREWFNSTFRVTFHWDFYSKDFPSHYVYYELVNVDGANAERETTRVKSSTPEEREAVRAMMEREIQNQFIADNFIPYPKMTIINPQPDQVLSGTVKVQVEVLSLNMGEFTVELKLDNGGWLNCAYNSSTKYYERSANTTGLPNGPHTVQFQAHDGLGVTLEIGPYPVIVEN